MQQNETLRAIIDLLTANQLGQAVRNMENYLLANPTLQTDMEKLQAIKSDYELMVDYWQQGFSDPQRRHLYARLVRRLYVLTSNMLLNDHLRRSPFMKNLYSRPRQSDRAWSVGAIRSQLEDYVSNQALLELEPEHTREPKARQLHEEHARLMDYLFDYIVTSRLWSDSLADSFAEMLLSPTIDTLDQQHIVSAITLSVLQAFGYNKFSVLCTVYEQAEDEALRQRALVGWVLALDAAALTVYPEVKERVAALCTAERTQQELTELQLQLFYCMDAEDDGRKIQNEIIPELMKGGNLRITRHGIEEVDEDSLEEILHPEAAEQNMEQMEKSMQRMADMHKQGADIYFGGFSQMKRFPFFNNLGAWFMPFSPQHPAVSTIWNNTKGKRFLEIVTKVGAFCDSDKYSFVLAFEQVLSRLPKSMLSMVEQGEASPIPLGGQIDIEEQNQPAFLRRLYLQNLYRFYKLFPVRSEFLNPLADAGRYLFIANPVFGGTPLQRRSLEVAAFLLKRKRTAELSAVLDSIPVTEHHYPYYMLQARMEPSPVGQRRLYRLALDEQPQSAQALSGWARSSFNAGEYDDAIEAYRQLTAMEPDKTNHQLKLAACLANNQRTEEAEPILFKLLYLYPDNLKVVRVLAWTLMAAGKYEQAMRYYDQLQHDGAELRNDIFNRALCLWLSGKTAEAIPLLKSLEGEPPIADSIKAERDFLLAHGLTDIDMRLMTDSLQG